MVFLLKYQKITNQNVYKLMFKLGLQNYFRIKLNTYNKTQVYIVKKTVSINKH